MIQELPIRNPQITPFRFKRYFESKNHQIRIFGSCEVTGKNFEVFVPVEGFFVYLQGFRSLTDALNSSSEEEHEFILRGISPEGRRSLNSNF
jgi:hypothetical protein